MISCNEACEDKIKTSFSILNLLILVYQLVLFAAIGRTIMYIRDYPAIANSLVWISCSIISLIRFRQHLTGFFFDTIRDRVTLSLIVSSVLIATAVIALSLEPGGVRFSWDSDTLYQFVNDLDFESLYDSKLMTFHSHVSIVYTYILVMFKLLFNDIRLAFWLLNSVCIVIASFGMSFLLKTIVPDKTWAEYALADSVFMFSPWVCGLSTYHIYDYYIWCLFPLLIYFLAKRNPIGFFCLGVMITFSKSTGLVVFGSVCVGILVTDLIANSVSALKNIKYLYYLSVAFIFFVFFKCGISESTQFEDTRFGLDASHILHQVKLYTASNLIWLFVIPTLALIIGVYVRKVFSPGEITRRVLSVILLSDVVFILFNMVCITYRMPRYMDSHIAVVYICSLVLISFIERKRLRYTIYSTITVLSVIASFKTIDPVSYALFNTIDVGNRTIVDYESSVLPSFEDSIVCNREYYSYEVLLNRALTYVMDNRQESDDILFSLGDQGITWGFSGGRYSYGYSDGKQYFELFYDKTINGLANGYSYDYWDSPDMIPFSIRYIFPQEDVSSVVSLSSSDRFYYIFMPTQNDGRENEIYDSYKVEDRIRFEFRGWIMECIVFSKY